MIRRKDQGKWFMNTEQLKECGKMESMTSNLHYDFANNILIYFISISFTANYFVELKVAYQIYMMLCQYHYAHYQ